MKPILTKISSILRNLFAFLRVTLTLQIGKAEVSKDDDLNKGTNEDSSENQSQEENTYD